jgi:uncharacterized RDD family membrane protein YckC
MATVPKVYFSYAGPEARIAAGALDLAILLFLTSAGLANLIFAKNFLLFWSFILIAFTYKPLTEGFLGATLGKKLLSIHIVDPQGKKISLKNAAMRFIPFVPLLIVGAAGLPGAIPHKDANNFGLLYIISSLIVLTDCAAIFISKEKRALHDLLSGSICVFEPGKKYSKTAARLALMPLCALLIFYAGPKAFIALAPLTKLKTLLPPADKDTASKLAAAANQEITPVVYEDCRVTGIMSQGTTPSIMVGKDAYHVGETVCKAKVIGISAGKATIQTGDTTTEVGVGGKIGS